MIDKEIILILMSTYNGGKHLAAQIESILSQTYPHWLLLIRDDGSIDNTQKIIHNFQSVDSRIIHVEDNLGNLGPCQSFSVLMENALNRTENYIFFADQDDIWIPNKLILQITKIYELQKSNLTNTPLLVFSDLCVVDKKLNLIHPSYLKYEKLKPNITSSINTLLVHNFVTGCTVGINRSLLAFAVPVPKDAIMHDWWCALCASSVGKIGFIETPTVLYRQHGQNTIGSTGFYQKLKKYFFLNSIVQSKKNFLLRFNQSKELMKRLKREKFNYKFILLYNMLPRKKCLARIRIIYQLNLLPQGIVRKLFFMYLIFFFPKS